MVEVWDSSAVAVCVLAAHRSPLREPEAALAVVADVGAVGAFASVLLRGH